MSGWFEGSESYREATTIDIDDIKAAARERGKLERTVAITGAGGYVGSAVTARLLDAGYDVIPIDNGYNQRVFEIGGEQTVDVDVRVPDEILPIFEDEDPDCVLHLAALSGVQECYDYPFLAVETNINATMTVAYAAKQTQTPLVFPSSMAAVGAPEEEDLPVGPDHDRRPRDHYGLTKAIGEWLLRHYGGFGPSEYQLDAIIFTISNVYGSHRVGKQLVEKGTAINYFIDRAIDDDPITVHEPGTQVRDFIHVTDVARAYERAVDKLVFNGLEDGIHDVPLAAGETVTIREAAEIVQDVVDRKLGTESEITMTANPSPFNEYITDLRIDTAPAREVLGFEADYDLEMGVEDAIARRLA